MQKKIYSEKPVFKVQKKHAWRDKFIRIIEIGLVVVVISGTVVWLLLSSNFSFEKLFKTFGNSVKPKITSNSATRKLSDEEKLKQLFSERKLIDVSSFEKTKEGDFQVSSKSGEVFIFSHEKNLDEQVSTLQTLFAKAKIEGKSLKKVDFRFSKIVVEF